LWLCTKFHTRQTDKYSVSAEQKGYITEIITYVRQPVTHYAGVVSMSITYIRELPSAILHSKLCS